MKHMLDNMNYAIKYICREYFHLHVILMTSVLCSPDILAQKYEVLYANFDDPIDTTKWELSPYQVSPDTLAKWIFLYKDGKALLKQTENSPYERNWSLLNKETREFDTFTGYNMSKNNVSYNDYTNNVMRHVSYFFDVKYIIEDELPYYEWTFLDQEKNILNYQCKLAKAKYPFDNFLTFYAWYTEKIPIQGGPMDLNGLPGLILEVERNGVLQYRALSIHKLPDDTELVVEKPAKDEQAQTMSEYQKMRTGVPFKNYNKRPPNKKNEN